MGVKADKVLVFVQKNEKDLTSLGKTYFGCDALIQGPYERKIICYSKAMVSTGVLWEGDILTEVYYNKGMITARVKRMGH